MDRIEYSLDNKKFIITKEYVIFIDLNDEWNDYSLTIEQMKRLIKEFNELNENV